MHYILSYIIWVKLQTIEEFEKYVRSRKYAGLNCDPSAALIMMSLTSWHFSKHKAPNSNEYIFRPVINNNVIKGFRFLKVTFFISIPIPPPITCCWGQQAIYHQFMVMVLQSVKWRKLVHEHVLRRYGWGGSWGYLGLRVGVRRVRAR